MDEMAEMIDHDAIRARVEKQLAPKLKLLRKRMWLFAHIALFIAVIALFSALSTSPVFSMAEVHQIVAQTFTDPMGNIQTFPAWSYTTYTPYFLYVVAQVAWVMGMIGHILIYWSAVRRERFIEKAMERETELEKLRLQAEISREYARGRAEKPKRSLSLSLSDDGELIENDEEADAPRVVRRRSTS